MKKVYVVIQTRNNDTGRHVFVDVVFASEDKAANYVAKENRLWGNAELGWTYQEWDVE